MSLYHSLHTNNSASAEMLHLGETAKAARVGSGSHKPPRTGIRRDIKVRERNREKLAASLLIYLL